MKSRDNQPVYAEERRVAICELVSQGGAVSVSDLCERFRVSAATIRSDLRDLDSTGRLVRTHGGAMPRQGTGLETSLANRVSENVGAKRTIAGIALACIEDRDTILLDVGTTIYELALLLGHHKNIRVVTNDLKIACLASDFPDLELHVLSGTVRPGYYCTVGASAVRDLGDFTVDKAFLATNGFNVGHGASTPDTAQADVKRAMIQCARKAFLLCDSSKFEKPAFTRFAHIPDIDVLITERISKDYQARVESAGIEVLTGKMAI